MTTPLLLNFMALCWAGNQVLGRAVAGRILFQRIQGRKTAEHRRPS
jgi:hypothetical protein